MSTSKALDVLRTVKPGPFSRLFEHEGQYFGFIGGPGVSYPPTSGQIAVEELIKERRLPELVNVFEIAKATASQVLNLYLENVPSLALELQITSISGAWSPMGLFYVFLALKALSDESLDDDAGLCLANVIQTVSSSPDLCRLLSVKMFDFYSGCILRRTSCLERMELETTFDSLTVRVMTLLLGIEMDVAFREDKEYLYLPLRWVCELSSDKDVVDHRLELERLGPEPGTADLLLKLRERAIQIRQNIVDQLLANNLPVLNKRVEVWKPPTPVDPEVYRAINREFEPEKLSEETQSEIKAMLVAGGFSEDEIDKAVLRMKGDMNEAAEWLLNNRE